MRTLRNLLWAIAALGLQACVVVTEDDLEAYEGLVVSWSIDDVEDVDWCDDLLIGSWRIAINGPESASIDVDCGIWDTDNEFTGQNALLIGNYNITVTAVDDEDVPIVSLTESGFPVDDLDGESPDWVHLDFDSEDFL